MTLEIHCTKIVQIPDEKSKKKKNKAVMHKGA